MLYKLRKVVIKLFHDYSSLVSEAKFKALQGEILKIFNS